MLKRLWQQTTVIFRWLKTQLRDNPTVSLPAAALYLLFIWIVWQTYKASNLGFGGKTLWNWMELLIIPTVLAISALLFSRAERKAEQQIAADRFQEEALQIYLDRMIDLLLERNLLASEYDAEVRAVARAQTLTTLRILDGKRKGVVLKFLSDSGLITKGKAVISLEKADLHEADLSEAALYEIDLGRANLCRANLRGVLLCKSWLAGADLCQASFVGADLRGCTFCGANLTSADLRDAVLEGDSREERTNLLDADLSGANFEGAFVSGDQLRHARSLKGTTLPKDTIQKRAA
jgi:uncharacterized protein YjbI with pentapeptide repeats